MRQLKVVGMVSKLRELRLIKAPDRNLGLDEPEPEALGGVLSTQIDRGSLPPSFTPYKNQTCCSDQL